VIRATLVTDGTSDSVLLEVLRWLVREATPEPVELNWFDPSKVVGPVTTLRDRLGLACEFHPCELLFVHRDAESAARVERLREVQSANGTGVPHVCVVPVRMTEAWLLIDAAAIRHAADRPRGAEPVDLPKPAELERLADPKRRLHDLLVQAAGRRGRRARKFRPTQAVHRLAGLIDDWSTLRRLAAFRALEADTRSALQQLGLPVSAAP
jgi:hypothetical protein